MNRKLPFTHIRVAGFDFKVVEWSRDRGNAEGKFAEFSAVQGCISIDVEKPFKIVDSLLHELVHAILWAYGYSTPDDKIPEEHCAGIISTGMVQVLRDNPKLHAYLNDKIKRMREGRGL